MSYSTDWVRKCLHFLEEMEIPGTGAFRSVPGGPLTLYGTCYSLLGQYYLGSANTLSEQSARFILNGQDPTSGLFTGPELREFKSRPGVKHDRDHLLLHLTCAALPTCQHYGIQPRHPLRAIHRFCDPAVLRAWLDQRDLVHAWFEGNNILFIGQLLVYLRDVEHHPDAARALKVWFDWLDEHIDPKTNLWGTNGFCRADEAVYGGYHQLLVYYHEDHHLVNPQGLVDTVLGLQHPDGGFNPRGNAGACEDVDSVDILVNCYKRFDYRRPQIRVALRRCLRHILATQNRDGGFPYNRDWDQTHMGIPGTSAPPNVSTTFPTWFRVHTAALMAEVLRDEPLLRAPFRFTKHLSMGWHPVNPPACAPTSAADFWAELPSRTQAWVAGNGYRVGKAYRATRRLGGRLLRRLQLR